MEHHISKQATIYKVHRHLREVNPKAYEPEILAIGPYHRGKDDLKMMEDHKFHYFNLLLQRIGKNADIFVSTIGPLESRARKSYAEPISLDNAEFIEMLILDGCFIIELVRKFYKPYWGPRNDPTFYLPWIFNSLLRDLMLFENQIPFFILCKLSDLIFGGTNPHCELTNLLLLFFENMYPLSRRAVLENTSQNVPSYDIKHLLDMIHRNWRPNSSEEDKRQKPTSLRQADVKANENSIEEKRVQPIESASRLEEANVVFERNREINNLFELDFKNGTIRMPPLNIDNRTESLFRNLIAYEQYFEDLSDKSFRYMSDYVHVLDCLIDSSKDIEVLRRKGIIKSWLGDEEAVAKMINKLGVSVAGPEDQFIYTKFFDQVNKHCRKRRNRWMAKLRRNYLNSPWAIISIIVATILLLLTVTQTVFGILQGV